MAAILRSLPLPSSDSLRKTRRLARAALCTVAILIPGNAVAAPQPVPAPDACTVNTQPTGPLGQPRPQADWAWLCRYRADNDRVQAAAARPQGVFIGDSITERWLRDDPDFFAPGRVGRGISGQTSAQVLLRFQQDALALKPRYIHLLVGTNDVAGNAGSLDQVSFRDNMRMMVALARQQRIRLFIGTIPPADRIFWREQSNVASRIRDANQWLKEFTTREGVDFIDYYTALATDNGALRPDFTEDGVHPNAAGYAAMRRVIAKNLPDMR